MTGGTTRYAPRSRHTETYSPYAISVAPQKTLPAKASTALIRSAEVPTPTAHATGAQAQKAENTTAPIPPSTCSTGTGR